jgi:phage-related protein
MWSVEFYLTKDGECPTEEFLNQLSPSKDLPFVMYDLDRLEAFGNELRPPQVRYLERHIYELRTETSSGQIRLLYFFFSQKKIIISHGIRKKQKIPAKEIDRAVANRNDYFERHELTMEKKVKAKQGGSQVPVRRKRK